MENIIESVSKILRKYLGPVGRVCFAFDFCNFPSNAKYILRERNSDIVLEKYYGTEDCEILKEFDFRSLSCLQNMQSILLECRKIVGKSTIWIEIPSYMYIEKPDYSSEIIYDVNGKYQESFYAP